MDSPNTPLRLGCGHNVPPQDCHNMWYAACPHHFSTHVSQALSRSIEVDGVAPFYEELRHLILDRYLAPAYYTWAAMIGRYSVPGADMRMGVLADGRVTSEDEVPEHALRVARLVETACRAAVANDPANLDAVLEVIADQGEMGPTLSFMMSLAASAGITFTIADACTPRHVSAYLLLGSQVHTGWGAVVLPHLVDFVVLHIDIAADRRSPEELPGVMARMADSADAARHLPIAVDIVCRALAQTIEIDATVVDQSSMAVVDVDGATQENTPREMMAMVWAIRASRAYAQSATPEDGNAALRTVVRQRGDALKFAIDVITAGTQMLAHNLTTPVPTDGSPG